MNRSLLPTLLLIALTAACASGGSSRPDPYVIPDDDVSDLPDGQRSIRAVKILGRAQSAALAGNGPKAVSLYKEALAIYASLDDASAQAAIYNDLSLLARATGDLAAARDFLERALQLAPQGDAPIVEAEARYNLGGVLVALGDLTAAERAFSDALTQARALNNTELVGLALSGRGGARRRQDNIAPATDDYQAALNQWDTLGRDDLAAVTHMNIGYCHVLIGASDDAAQSFQDAIARLGGAPPADRALLVPHLEELIRLVKRDPAAARERVLELTGR